MSKMYPFKLEPIYVKTVWGSEKLAKIRQKDQIIGSSWEISAHPNADNKIVNGAFAGKTLIEMLDEYPKEMLGELKKNQMLRISFMDASQSLSIQVHPDDAYAHKYANDEGKVEAWYIVEAEPGAKLIAGTTDSDAEVIKKAVKNETIEDYVQRIEMEAGDFICIDSCQLHAFGAGMLGLEISQNSDTTYRFYDFHRKDDQGKERQLHLKECFDVVDFTKRGKKMAFPKLEMGLTPMLSRKEFSADALDLNGEYTLVPNKKTFYCLSNVGGSCEVIYGDESISLEYTENVFVPAACDAVTLKGQGRIIISYVEGDEK